MTSGGLPGETCPSFCRQNENKSREIYPVPGGEGTDPTLRATVRVAEGQVILVFHPVPLPGKVLLYTQQFFLRCCELFGGENPGLVEGGQLLELLRDIGPTSGRLR